MWMLGVLISHSEVCQVATVAVADSNVPMKIFSFEKNPDLMMLTALQLVEEFPTPLLSHFLSIWG